MYPTQLVLELETYSYSTCFTTSPQRPCRFRNQPAIVHTVTSNNATAKKKQNEKIRTISNKSALLSARSIQDQTRKKEQRKNWLQGRGIWQNFIKAITGNERQMNKGKLRDSLRKTTKESFL